VQLEQEAKELDAKRTATLGKIGNILGPDVPTFKSEDDNKVRNTWGDDLIKVTVDENKLELGALRHHEVMFLLDMVDLERGAKIAKHRGYFLKGNGVLLNQALINYGLKTLVGADYTPLQPPFFMKSSIMHETCQLSDFEENLYKVEGVDDDEKDKEHLYLIATSEQPISAMYRGEQIDPKELPIRYAGTSSCFRKEAGSGGKDLWGIFRVHQFEKVEQFILTKPDQSW
jgi:seryl-tRNA synthetase